MFPAFPAQIEFEKPRNIVDKGGHRGGHDEAQQSLLVQLERSGNCEVPLDGHRHCEVGGADSATNKAKCPLDAVETPLSHCYTLYVISRMFHCNKDKSTSIHATANFGEPVSLCAYQPVSY